MRSQRRARIVRGARGKMTNISWISPGPCAEIVRVRGNTHGTTQGEQVKDANGLHTHSPAKPNAPHSTPKLEKATAKDTSSEVAGRQCGSRPREERRLASTVASAMPRRMTSCLQTSGVARKSERTSASFMLQVFSCCEWAPRVREQLMGCSVGIAAALRYCPTKRRLAALRGFD